MEPDRHTPTPEIESVRPDGAPDAHSPPTDPPHRAIGRPVVLAGGLIALLILAAGAYFVVDRNGASQPGSEQAVVQNPAPVAATAPPAAPEPARNAPQTAAPAAADTQVAVAPPPAAPEPARNAPQTAAPAAAATQDAVAPPPAAPEPARNAPQTAAPAPAATQPAVAPPPAAPGPAPAAQPAAPAPAQRVDAASNSVPDAPPAPPATTRPSMSDQPASLPKDAFVFVQRPGVNIRSAPGRSGRVVGTAAKGSRLKVLARSGNWVEIETGSGSGWISGKLLGAQSP
jgi:hypothetical protein